MSSGRILISYSHDDEPHRAQVLALADALRAAGVDAWIDRYEAWPREGWERWMQAQVESAAAVIAVCTDAYLERFDRGEGTGVGFEATLLRALAARGTRPLTIAVRFDRAGDAPLLLGGKALRVVPWEGDSGFKDLVRAVMRTPEIVAPSLGERPEWLARPPVRSAGSVDAATPGHGALAEHTPALLAWLDWVVETTDHVLLGRDGTRAPLERVYVRPSERAVGGGVEVEFEDLVRRDPLGRWSVQGDPGSGKTTLLRHLALDLARGAREALERGVLAPATVPVLVPLGAVTRGRRVEDLAVDLFADDPVQGRRRGDHSPEAVRRALAACHAEGRLVYLLDGLDEVRADRRDEIAEALHRLAGPEHRCAVALSTRRFGYRKPSERYLDYELLPFDRPRQLQLLAGLGCTAPDRVLAQIDNRRTLREMATNPLMLTLLAEVVQEGEPLPARRADVYDAIVGRLLRSRRVGGDDDAVHRRALGALAWRLLDVGGGTWAWPRAELEAEGWQVTGIERAIGGGDVCSWLATRCGLVVDEPRGGRRQRRQPVQFLHRTLLEFLAAEHLSIRSDVADLAARVAGDGPALAAWAEVFALWVGDAGDPMAALRTIAAVNPALATRALPEVEELDLDAVLGFLGLTGNALGLVHEVLVRVRDGTVDRPAAGRLVLRIARDRGDCDTAKLCGAAAFVLGDQEIVDAVRALHPDHDVAPYRWVRCPPDGHGATFLMGSEDGREDERPAHEVTVQAFWMLNVPVTRALYGVVTGEDRVPHGKTWLLPAVNVSLKEAVAWSSRSAELNARLAGMRLPTEPEWEGACRAGTTTRWSFGDDKQSLSAYGWSDGNSGGVVQAVGCKLPNAWGLRDMHGNVWEWCGSLYSTYPGPPLSYEKSYVLRGGSCWFTPDWSRSACRISWTPDRKGALIGFRVVLPIPP